ncbi:MAG: tripartite tricarboxylate transporter substrate binding protein [Pleomorphochaeta sp.]
MKKRVLAVFVILIIVSVYSFAAGQEEENVVYPNKAVKVICPYGAGGGTDLTGRVLIKEVEEILGQPFNFENISGASGTVGSSVVSTAAPDGYTLLFSPSDPMTTQPNKLDLPYDINSFECIAGFSAEASVIAVRTDSPWQSLDDLLAEANTGKVINRGHSGIGGINHLCLQEFFNQTDLKFRDVPFEGGALAIAALLGNHIDVVGGTAGAMVPYIESGEIRVLAIASEERSTMFADVPTFKEEGFDLVFSVDWFLLAPKGTPDDVVKTLEEAAMEAAESDAFKAFVKERGQQLLIRDGDTMKAKITKDYEMYKEILNR